MKFLIFIILSVFMFSAMANDCIETGDRLLSNIEENYKKRTFVEVSDLCLELAEDGSETIETRASAYGVRGALLGVVADKSGVFSGKVGFAKDALSSLKAGLAMNPLMPRVAQGFGLSILNIRRKAPSFTYSSMGISDIKEEISLAIDYLENVLEQMSGDLSVEFITEVEELVSELESEL